MEISGRFIEILKSIDYHVGHLPKHLFANEEQIPELLPIFTWLINNVSPKVNCVRPKEMMMYDSIASKHDHFSSLKKISEAFEKLNDTSVKNTNVCSLDLENLEKQILKSEHELNDLKVHETLLEKKSLLVDDEITVLKNKEKSISLSCFKSENDLSAVLKTFIDEANMFGSITNKLHDHVNNSMTNDDECLPKLASKNLTNLTESWRQQIFKMINTLFNKENVSSINDSLTKMHSLGLLYQSVSALKMAEENEKCEIDKLNVIMNNIHHIKNYYDENKENLHPREQDIINYFAKHVQERIMSASNNQKSTMDDGFEDLQSCILKMVVESAEKKHDELNAIDDRITFVKDSIEHYILVCDVLWCLMRVSCSMANVKCELVLHCMDLLQKTCDEIAYAQKWFENLSDINVQNTDIKNTNLSFDNIGVKFDGYKPFSHICTDSDEIEKLTKMVQEWKSKYHYTRDECNKLTGLQNKLQVYSSAVKELTNKYSNTM